MVFTVISILMSVFEYFLSTRFIYVASTIVIKLMVESNDISQMSYKTYRSKIVSRQHAIILSIAKILKITSHQVERLKPKLVTNGIMFTFIISIDESHYDNIKLSMEKAVYRCELAKVCCLCMNEIYIFLFAPKKQITNVLGV